MSKSFKPLAEQVIVITGASSGIGLCVAQKASKAGARLVLAARSKDALDEVESSLNAEGGTVIRVVADVAQRDQVLAIADAAGSQFGRIDTWINDAGVSIYGRLDEVADSDSRRLFDTNFWGVVNGSLVALPWLLIQGGVLINLGSEVSDAVVPLQGMYSASKHAVKGFTDALRVEIEEVDKAPVEIVLIQPTAVDTPYAEHAASYLDRQPKLPSPMIDPEKVADAILKAAVEGGRDIRVGAMSVMNTIMAKVAPSLGDKMAAKQVDRQERDVAPQRPEGALYDPSGGPASVHGQSKAGSEVR